VTWPEQAGERAKYVSAFALAELAGFRLSRSRLSTGRSLACLAAVRAAWFTRRRPSGLAATLRACAMAFLPWSLRAMTTAAEITRRPFGLVASPMPFMIGPIMGPG
jgi:hypothetical protein